jgi:hypothetical protein
MRWRCLLLLEVLVVLHAAGECGDARACVAGGRAGVCARGSAGGRPVSGASACTAVLACVRLIALWRQQTLRRGGAGYF